MIQFLKYNVHKKLIHILGVNLIFGNTVIIVIYSTTVFQTVFQDNENTKNKKGLILILNRKRL